MMAIIFSPISRLLTDIGEFITGMSPSNDAWAYTTFCGCPVMVR